MKENWRYIYMVFSFFCLITLTAQTPKQEKYAQVKIYTSENGLTELAGLGLAVDHGIHKKDAFFIGDFSESELIKIRAAGFTYEVLQDDLTNYYVERNKTTTGQKKQSTELCEESTVRNYAVPEGFNYGSMGGYLTYNELLAELDSMTAEYGHLITARTEIGNFRTHENRPIYWLKISDNPNIDEKDVEPQILYTALHHAREPMSMMQMIFYMHYLLENYGKEEEITHLINNTELCFIPCINPDGYVYNEEIAPEGGGMWRKNKQDNDGDGFFDSSIDGVDLNRNYGYEWGHDNVGSSLDRDAQTYRGAAPFSEAETQAVRFLCENNQFKITLNYHSFSNLLIYPWGYEPSSYTPDSTLYREYADWMTQENHYLTGTGNETLNYLMNGNSDDWMYGEQQSKDKILAFIPEVGSQNDGFWPAKERIIPLCQQNMWQNLAAAHLIQQYAVINDFGDKYIDSKNAIVQFSLMELGLQQGEGFTVSIEPIDEAITNAGNGAYVTSTGQFQTTTSSLFFQLNEQLNIGDSISFYIKVSNDAGAIVFSQKVNKHLGTPFQYHENDFSNSPELSTLTDNFAWNLTDEAFISPPSCLTDSPYTSYENNADNRVILLDTLDLTDCAHATLQFWAKWDIETGYDYVQIEAEDLQTSALTVLCGEYAHLGVPSQNTDYPLYDGKQKEWVREKISLNTFIGKKIKLHLYLHSDDFVTADGFYLDDLNVQKLPIPNAAIPTVSEWGLMLLSLLLLNFGTLFILQQQYSLAHIKEQTHYKINNSLPSFPFILPIFKKALLVSLLIAFTFFFISLALTGTITTTDFIGTLVCLPFLGYLLHLWGVKW